MGFFFEGGVEWGGGGYANPSICIPELLHDSERPPNDKRDVAICHESRAIHHLEVDGSCR